MHVLADTEPGVEHLHRELGLVAVRRLVDGRHATHAEHGVEAVLPAKDRPDALLRVLLEVRFAHDERVSC